MATKITLVKVGGVLRPGDDDARAVIAALTPGTPVLCELRQGRSVRQHRFAMGLFRKVWENMPEAKTGLWPRVENLRDAILIATGYVEQVIDVQGMAHLRAKSIAFDKMSQDEFGRFVQDAIAVICRDVVPGLDSAALEEEVLDMVA